ncbi:hypothetical protein SI65_08122 [Aspergillus cristatus]|uniref:Uncharacterized protein n=1 Tax=Aspergillus cristatus TaxID=573508 RepID=A0A1E3B6L8_ASPCR|nr:hypothetical protein SI65_08122 [Aspergillus cristatus]
MGTMETIASNDRVNQRRQGLSWSLSFRSSTRKRPGIVRPSTPPPTCEERVHYPVFNPHDPRHNPTVIPPSWLRGSYSLSEDSSSTHTSGRWHSLSEKSLRKARSGLDAIRSGMHRRPSVDQQGPRRDLPGLWMSTDSRGSSINRPDGSFPSTISEASTDDEFEFGTDLYRTRPNGSSKWNLEIVNRYLNEVGSSHALPPDVYSDDVETSPAGSRLEGETLNNPSEEDSEVTTLPSKPQTIRWDDRVQSGRRPSLTSASSSVISSRASTSSDESTLSQLINATQAFEALCSIDEPTKNIPDSSDVEHDADDSLPATSQGSAEVLPEGAASQSNGSTRTNSEEADNQSRSDNGETPADKPSRETSRASSMNASGGSNSSTGQGNRSRHSTCQSDSTAPTSRT